MTRLVVEFGVLLAFFIGLLIATIVRFVRYSGGDDVRNAMPVFATVAFFIALSAGFIATDDHYVQAAAGGGLATVTGYWIRAVVRNSRTGSSRPTPASASPLVSTTNAPDSTAIPLAEVAAPPALPAAAAAATATAKQPKLCVGCGYKAAPTLLICPRCGHTSWQLAEPD